jgi:putative transposase
MLDKNRIRALALTGKADLSGKQRLILGAGRFRHPASRDTCTSMCIVDHGTRALFRLSELRNKSSLTIPRELIATFRKFGIPRALRTDNERCFTSKAMQLALMMLGIKHQRTEPHCPWVSRAFVRHRHAPTNDRTGMCGPDCVSRIAQQNRRIERFFGTLKQHLD